MLGQDKGILITPIFFYHFLFFLLDTPCEFLYVPPIKREFFQLPTNVCRPADALGMGERRLRFGCASFVSAVVATQLGFIWVVL